MPEAGVKLSLAQQVKALQHVMLMMAQEQEKVVSEGVALAVKVERLENTLLQAIWRIDAMGTRGL